MSQREDTSGAATAGGRSLATLCTSRSFHSFLGIVFSGGLLWFILSDINFKDVREPLLSAHYWIIIPALPLTFLHVLIRAWRWYYLLPSRDKTSLRERHDSIMVGNFANFVLPLRAGEFVRPFLLSRVTRVSFAEGFASIVTERFFDLAAAIISLAILIPFLPALPEWVSLSAYILGGVAVGILFFILFVIFLPDVTRQAFSFLLKKVAHTSLAHKAQNFLDDFIASSHVLACPKNLFMVLWLTVLVWVSNYLLFYLFLFLLDVPATFLLGTTVAVMVALAVAAPSAPGFIGVYQIACQVGFELFYLSKEDALVYSLVTHLFQFIVFVLYGLYVLSLFGVRLTELRQESQISLEQIENR